MTLPTGAAHADSWRRTALLRAGGPQTCTHLTKPPQPCCLASLPGQLLAWLSSANTDLSVADRPAKPSGPATARSTGMKARPTPTKAALQATMPSTVSLAPHGTCAGGGGGQAPWDCRWSVRWSMPSNEGRGRKRLASWPGTSGARLACRSCSAVQQQPAAKQQQRWMNAAQASGSTHIETLVVGLPVEQPVGTLKLLQGRAQDEALLLGRQAWRQRRLA